MSSLSDEFYLHCSTAWRPEDRTSQMLSRTHYLGFDPISSGNMKGIVLGLWDLQVLIVANVFITYLKRGDDIYSRRTQLPSTPGPLIRVQQWTAGVMGEMPERSGAPKHDAYWAGRMATVAHMVASLTQTGQLGPGQAWSLYRPIVCLQCSR